MDKQILAATVAYAEAQLEAAQAFLASLSELEETEEVPAKSTPAKKTAAPAKKAALPAKKAVSKAKPEPEPEEEEESAEDIRRAELEAMRITQLKALAKKRGFKEDEVASADKPTLVEAILSDQIEAGDLEGAAEDSEEETEETTDEEIQFDREDLQKKGLRELKAMAKAADFATSDYNGLDKDSLIDLLLDEGDSEDEEDADSEDGDEDEEMLTEEDLRAMSLPELRKLAKEYEISVPRGAKSGDIVDLIMEQAAGQEDEDEGE